jgi:hypothetical protein
MVKLTSTLAALADVGLSDGAWLGRGVDSAVGWWDTVVSKVGAGVGCCRNMFTHAPPRLFPTLLL